MFIITIALQSCAPVSMTLVVAQGCRSTRKVNCLLSLMLSSQNKIKCGLLLRHACPINITNIFFHTVIKGTASKHISQKTTTMLFCIWMFIDQFLLSLKGL